MKLLLGVFIGIVTAFPAFSQSTVTWSTPSSPITTNDFQGHTGSVSGVNHYRFGLYAGPAGSTEDSLAFIALTTNSATIAGTFTSVPNVLLPFPNGSTIAYQVRGWSLFAGATYDVALAYGQAGGNPTAFLGKSPLGSYLIGSGPLQSGAFVLTPVPEPSTVALLMAAVTVVGAWKSRRTKCD